MAEPFGAHAGLRVPPSLAGPKSGVTRGKIG